jgi:hypothetical protein
MERMSGWKSSALTWRPALTFYINKIDVVFLLLENLKRNLTKGKIIFGIRFSRTFPSATELLSWVHVVGKALLWRWQLSVHVVEKALLWGWQLSVLVVGKALLWGWQLSLSFVTNGVRVHTLQAKNEPVNLGDLVNKYRTQKLRHCTSITFGEASFMAGPKAKLIHLLTLHLTLSITQDTSVLP